MKNFTLLFGLLFLIACSSEPKQQNSIQDPPANPWKKDVAFIEKQLFAMCDSMYKVYPQDEGQQVQRFTDALVNYISANPETMDADFKLMEDSCACTIKTSEDGKFRIYSWYLYNGGTMSFHDNLFQWRSGDKVYTKRIKLMDDGDPSAWFSKILSYDDNGKRYYLAEGHSKYSTQDLGMIVRGFTIDEKGLNDSVQLFVDQGDLIHDEDSGPYNDMGIEINTFRIDSTIDIFNLMRYDAQEKILYFPASQDSMTGIMDKFKLVNGKFIKQ